jgi:hypothetical protein
LGALLAGLAFDLSGHYEPVLALFIAAYMLAATLIFLANSPRARRRAEVKGGDRG